MSRQFKLKIISGFTSPKQPSHRESAITTHKHPTFLTLTQNINNNHYISNTDRQHNHQQFINNTNNVNSHTERVPNPRRHMNSTQRFQGENSEHKSVNNFHIQEFKPQITITQEQIKRKKSQQNENNLIKAIENITIFLKSKLLKLKKTSFKSIVVYSKNKQSIKLMARFKQHCAIIIQKQFRRYITQKYYRQFKIFINRIKPSINAFQLGWKLRKIMQSKPISSLIVSIKSSNNQKQSRILKRQMSFQITRLFKGNKWLNFKEEQKIIKQNIYLKSALLDKQYKQQPILKQQLEHSLGSILQTKPIIIKNDVFESKNTWQDIPIKPMNKQSFDHYKQENSKVELQIPKKSKPQKTIRKLNIKSNTSIPKSIDKLNIYDEINIQKQLKQKSQNKSVQKQETQKSKQKVSLNRKMKSRDKSKQVSQQKSSKQLLLEKRTKYDPRKASQQSRVRNLLLIEQNKTTAMQSVLISPKHSSILQSIKEAPKFQPENKRNILPKQVNVSLSKTQIIHSPIPQASRVIKQKHVGIGQLQNVFYNTYGNKMTCVVQKLKRINRTTFKNTIPELKVNSNFYRQYNPRYFNTFANRTMAAYQQ